MVYIPRCHVCPIGNALHSDDDVSYQMNKLVAEIRSSMERSVKKKKQQKDSNQPIFEYDSDEEVEGGTWEHKKRAEEMMSTLGMYG